MSYTYHQGFEEPVSLENPLYNATFPEAVERFIKKAFVFTGRASKREFWFASLFVFGVSFILNLIPMMFMSKGAYLVATHQGFSLVTVFDWISYMWALAALIPLAALMSRRLHDANLSTWYLLIMLIPIVSFIFYIIVGLLPSNPQGIRFDEHWGGGEWVLGSDGRPMELGGQAEVMESQEFIPMYPGSFEPPYEPPKDYVDELEPTPGYEQTKEVKRVAYPETGGFQEVEETQRVDYLPPGYQEAEEEVEQIMHPTPGQLPQPQPPMPRESFSPPPSVGVEEVEVEEEDKW